ncbi:pentatricopeptide repeat-containing protein At1g77170, mitochondrial [Andrographis paniculata]|uniref:pentatricopeptide repeat-containing protein At1g77170, mitochondrial n=1 Tax=Andrographis paniculata TaxID=175694 RepID=UPI0021E73FD3|nr:pentatricopeptide repeat-containing protein At1g77170, mitochondrial [Andrographis paniculata]
MKFRVCYLPKLSKTKYHFFRHFYHNVSRSSFGGAHETSGSALTFPSHQSIWKDAKAVALQVSNCTDLKHLRQVFSLLIRTCFLQSYPYSFHYNNISRVYSRLESPKDALNVYITMCRAGIPPDNFTLPIVVKAATQISDNVFVEQVHGISIKHGFDHDMYCQSGLISFYCKAGQLQKAHRIFMNCTEKPLGSWNAIIGGLSQGGCSNEAVQMFISMMRDGLSPDNVTLASVTSACGVLGDLNLGFQLHKFVFQVKPLENPDIRMMNSVIDMYGKCGRMHLAYKVFIEMEERNVSSWTSMIVGYVVHGHVGNALEFFRGMIEGGVTPNEITFVGILSACVHGGMVCEGRYYFNMMTQVYGIKPRLPHYGCMVDLLGRAGLFDEAKMMVEGMPMKANVVIWGCLMGACEKYGNLKMGEWVGRHLIELEPWNDGVFVALSNIYARHGMWKEVERCRMFMKEKNLAKLPAYSLPERALVT